MKTKNQLPLPVEISPDPRYFLRIEDNDGNSDSLAYFQLTKINRTIDRKGIGAILKLDFGASGVVEVKGQNTDHLLQMLEEEKVSLIRVGQNPDESGVHISSVRVINLKTFTSSPA